MNPLKQKLIDEQSSPLFRIMSVFNDTDAARRKFEGNICAFHVGKGYIISVFHYLRLRCPLIHSTPDSFFQTEILSKFPTTEHNQLNRAFPLDASTNNRYLAVNNQNAANKLIKKFAEYKCDTRVQTLYTHGVCKPFLIVQFRNNQFFNDPTVTAQIDPRHILYEAHANRYTFLLELELLHVFSERDMAIYRLANAGPDIIRLLPSISVDYAVYDDESPKIYCLQNSPSNTNAGRLLNCAYIEGILDQHALQADDIAGTYLFEGLRYLIRGYFRFGSSGAPYLRFDDTSAQFAVAAMQSEACPIQLTIKNEREGNSQWVNAIATPLSLIKDDLQPLLRNT